MRLRFVTHQDIGEDLANSFNDLEQVVYHPRSITDDLPRSFNQKSFFDGIRDHLDGPKGTPVPLSVSFNYVVIWSISS